MFIRTEFIYQSFTLTPLSWYPLFNHSILFIHKKIEKLYIVFHVYYYQFHSSNTRKQYHLLKKKKRTEEYFLLRT